ncbi:hypothetical protein [Maridesulfovibrio salexigens]|uniref:Uncharacterized protein n=1 Tax=Maridesulfovibrio salexigens (strain ATCC 14822 / DSM 2638 / NCIMB 8403 / VKM B-1763) TaxID=526222 RepID=C6BW89_MARSD|nr:hypothetical protein [Maridesulfovibrio salexigens]ACS78333.1 hypothetical protein Desal_0266 [Maridesulfovibrio salexigens DSM 2638]
MKKLIAIALLVGSVITAFYGFSLTAPMLAGKTMSDVNDIMGNMHIEYEVNNYTAGTENRCIPFYVVALLAGAAGVYVLYSLGDHDEEDFF